MTTIADETTLAPSTEPAVMQETAVLLVTIEQFTSIRSQCQEQ